MMHEDRDVEKPLNGQDSKSGKDHSENRRAVGVQPGSESWGVMRKKGQLTIPADMRQAAHLEDDAPVIFALTPEGVLVKPGKIVASEQAWFWTERWQQMEREADQDIASGRVARFEDVDSFIADLDS